MHDTTAPASHSHLRGVIYVDAYALKALAMPMGNDPQARYTTALDFLSDHGYDVRFTAFEALCSVGVAPSGRHTNDLFTHSSNHRKVLQGSQFVISMLRKRHKHMGLELPDPGDHTEGARLIQSFVSCKEDDSTLRSLIVRMNQMKELHAQFYREAIEHAIKHRPSGVPVFLLTTLGHPEDHYSVERDPPCGVLNIRGLLNALKKQNLLQPAGIDNASSIDEMIKHMEEGLNREQDKTNNPAPVTLTRISYDRILGDPKSESLFLQSLEGIREEIDATTAKTAASHQEERPVSSRIKDFEQKFRGSNSLSQLRNRNSGSNTQGQAK